MDINLIDNKSEKIELAKRILPFVKDGQVIGFGSGSTSYLAGIEIGKMVKDKGIKIFAIPTSSYMADVCNEYGIDIAELHDGNLDWCFDGADEVDANNNMIKGMGAAMFKEKLNILNSKKTYILIDNSKFVNFLGENHPVPIEVFPTSEEYVSEKLRELGVNDIRDREGFGSTDMGDVSHCCPTIHPYFPLTTKHLVGHTIEFATATIQEEAYKGMKEASLSMALSCIDIFENNDILKEIKQDKMWR